MRTETMRGLFLLGLAAGTAAAVGAGSAARAAGTVVTVTEGATGQVGAPALQPLLNLQVTARMDDTKVEIDETRTIAPPGWNTFGSFDGTFSTVVYRSLSSAPGAEVLSVEVDFAAHGYTILEVAEADLVREALVEKLADPAPIREMGTKLLVLDPFERDLWAYPPMVRIVTREPLSPRGTLRGVSVPVDWHKAPVETVSLTVEAKTEAELRALYSPFHTLDVTRLGPHEVTGTYSGWQRCSSFDVTLMLSTGSEPVRLDLLPFRYAPSAEDGFLMALLSTGDAGASAMPRDLVLTLDTSGSMSGEKIQQAKAALSKVLDGLRPADRFALVTFDGAVETFGTGAVAATPEAVAAAKAHVSDLVAGGGTNIHGALDASFQALPASEGNPRYIVFLTDGVPTEGVTDVEAILDLARTKNEVGARLFTFGIGNDVNTVLLDKLAMESAGDALYIPPYQPVDEAVASFFASIADPVLADPVLDLSDFGGHTLYPEVMQDLFAGQTASVLGRITKGGKGQIVLQGSRNGALEHHVFEVTLPEHDTTEAYVPRVWATRHVGTLLQAEKLGEGSEAQVAEVLAVAERFGVVTEYTYFEVDEAGDARMVYSPVPVAAVGAAAVGTSSTLDSYQKGGTVGDLVDTWIRYVWDRTFPTFGGWFTDTTVLAAALEGATWTEVRFGSDAWFELARNESALGLPAFLAVDQNVRFEHLGRRFRVTDAGSYDGQVPPEATSIPTPKEVPDPAATTVQWLGLAEDGAGSGCSFYPEDGAEAGPGDSGEADPGAGGTLPKTAPCGTGTTLSGSGNGNAALDVEGSDPAMSLDAGGEASGCAGRGTGAGEAAFVAFTLLALAALARRRA